MFTIQDLKKLPPEKVKEALSQLTPLQLEELQYDWKFWGRPEQQEPKGNWKIWMPLAGRGWGKLVCQDTDIITKNGWKKVKDVKVGDYLYDEFGNETRVLKTFDALPQRAYRLTFSDGNTLDVCDEHQWVTWTHRERKSLSRNFNGVLPHDWAGWSFEVKDRWGNIREVVKPTVKTTQEIVDTFTYGKRQDLNHSIPLTKPLNFNEKPLKVDPYIFGYWLGDGYKFGGTFTCDPKDQNNLISNIEAAGYKIGENNCYKTVSALRLVTDLKSIGAYGKFIPHDYYYCSKEQRLAILQGLMDSDGYAEKSKVEFTAKRKEHAEYVYWLATSLGQKPTIFEGVAKLDGEDCGTKYRVIWRPTQGINPFRLERKANKIKFGGQQESRNYHRMIVKFEEIPQKPMRCFTVDSPNSLFLVGKGLIPTHNTRCGAEWVRHRIKSGDRRIACVAPTKGDVRRVMVEGESGLLNICWKGDKTYRGAEMGFPVWSPTNNSVTWANGAKAEFFSAEDPERLRGPQFHSAWCFIEGTQVVTDAGEKDVKTLQVGQRVLTSKGFKRILATSQRPSIVGTVKFSNGKELTGTYEHPVWTNQGWVRLGELKEKDIVCAINVLNGTVSGGIPTETTTNTEEQGQKAVKIEKDCTGQFTKITTEKFQKVSTYITKMMIKLTTAFQTLNSYRGRNICATTEKSLPSQGQILSQCGTKQAAKTVVMWLKEKLLLKKSSANSVSSKGQTTSVKLLESARIVEKPLCLFEETSVVNVVSTWEEKTEQVVYNIQVEECHEYFANGILTHNCDEICAWTRMQETWDMLQFTLRLGKNPRILVTTTPKPVKLLRQIIKPENIASGRVYKTSGSSYENSDNIDLEALSQYEGTRLGRQELYAEILDEAAGALWNRKMIDDAQFDLPEDCIVKDEDGIAVDFDASRKEFAKSLLKVVVSVDPAITSNEESDLTGIVVAGIDINGNAYILEDATDRYMPEQWAAKAINLYNDYEADLIVAERNQGGDMVRSTLRTVDDTVPIKMVHASRGKYARAEPVSSLYERGKVKHLKYLEDLEEQMVTWEPLGSIGSPDRLDAMVWAVTNLLLKGYAQAPIKISYGKTINF